MAQDNTLARSLPDLGLATWFGGSLMGAGGLNGAAAVVDQPRAAAAGGQCGLARTEAATTLRLSLRQWTASV
jgi:hypothetical protein